MSSFFVGMPAKTIRRRGSPYGEPRTAIMSPTSFCWRRGSLTFAQYNAVLADFIARIAAPVTAQFGFTISTTEPRQTLDDWLSPDAALKLKRFSGAANKSTGASHPLDERRWFDFLVAVHRSGDKPGADRLARWLHEVDGWDEDSAHNLAGDFETALALLAYYEEH